TLIAQRISGVTCLYFGDFAGAHEHFQKTIELYDQAWHGDFANRFGQDPRAHAEIYDAVALWVLGRIDKALRLADRALTDADSGAHGPTMGNALAYAAFLGLFRYNPEAVATYSQALTDIVSRYDLPAFWARYFCRSGQSGPMMPKSRDSARCDAASPSNGSKVSFGSRPVLKRPWPKPKRVPVRLMPGSGAWTMRSPSWGTPKSAGTKRRCTASAARFCCSATRPIP